MKLILENFRSFAGRHEIEIRPLTLLVGENSSGKTNLLSALAAVLSEATFPFATDFNSSPYDLGPFEAIRFRNGGQIPAASEFRLGLTCYNPASSAKLEAVFGNLSGSARAISCDIDDPPNQATVNLSSSADGYEAIISAPGLSKRAFSKVSQMFVTGPHWIQSLSILAESANERDAAAGSIDPAYRYGNRAFAPSLLWLKPESIGPVRTGARRTYDPATRGPLDPSEDSLNQIRTLGLGSGLFSDIRTSLVGPSSGGRYEIQVKVDSAWRNLADVGFGVSQILPILSASLRSNWLIVQQPEVHLHPRAQAALGSFFAARVMHAWSAIETHSDYLLDRVRIEVARGNIQATDVQFLFFERSKLGTKVHPMELDSMGNIVDAPPSYGKFFLAEQMNLLGRGSK